MYVQPNQYSSDTIGTAIHLPDTFDEMIKSWVKSQITEWMHNFEASQFHKGDFKGLVQEYNQNRVSHIGKAVVWQ